MPPRYIIDTSAILDLQGHNSNTSLTNDVAIREQAWRCLETLIDGGIIVTVAEVRDELKRHSRACYDRLKPRFRKMVQRSSVAVLTRTGVILDNHPTLVRHLDRRDANREPADPYVIAYGQLNGLIVVTNELARSERSKNSRSGDHIPDVCSSLGIVCMKLLQLIQAECPHIPVTSGQGIVTK